MKIDQPDIEVLFVRDPDGPDQFHVFVNGTTKTITLFTIDAGAGWCWKDWKDSRDAALSTASAQARRTMLTVYADPPGGSYIQGRDEAEWLEGVPFDLW
ncbi:hypothetical protein AB0M45_20080 [Nocardia sp. NPDC051787]|uniref:hypothetical protein n=1 Tax=Nocardia sp. NPDC051787 TaxID=3155415 RepID=UPI0034153A6B